MLSSCAVLRLLLTVLFLLVVATAHAQAPVASVNVLEAGASGSDAQTPAATTAGSNRITVANPADFKVGQGVMVSRCNIRYLAPRIWGPTEPYSTCKPLGDAVEFRGYDGSASSWIVYILEVDGTNPTTFRWSDDLARTWKANKVPVTNDWQALSGGTEVRFSKRDWQKGHMITFSARDQLMTTVTAIDDKTLTLKDPANRSAADAVVRHDDAPALQAAINRAIAEKRNVYFPPGYYRLSRSLSVAGNVHIEGHDGVNTVLDLSDGEGSCFSLSNANEITVRNFRLKGHTGLEQAAASFRLSSGFSFWACALKSCNAISVSGVQRVLIENCHASQMASEAFYCSGSWRSSTSEPVNLTKSLTWSRCSATDCAANGFNNNDVSENVYMLNCRVDGAGWHAYEGPARFIHVEGCYIRRAGPITIGDMSHRTTDLNQLGCGQAVVRNNVFEGIGRCEGVAINHGAGQVVVADNLFINYNGPAINASSYTVRTSYPSRNVIITGNIIDMTFPGEKPAGRTAITVSASGTTVADNQIYVRGKTDPLVTAIRVAAPALDVKVHDNLIRNCGTGLRTVRAGSRVTEVIDSKTFLEDGLPLEWEQSHLYRGWPVVWVAGQQATGTSVIDTFDAATLRFKLRDARELKVGERFEVRPPNGENWAFHHNTITGCQYPVVLDSYGGPTSSFNDNIVQRGGCEGVKEAVTVKGNFALTGNTFSGFDEPDSAVLALYPDRLGKPCPNLISGNTFDQCANPISESVKGLWSACRVLGNIFTNCGVMPLQGALPSSVTVAPLVRKIEPPAKPTLRAGAVPAALKIDGDVKEWPWTDAKRTIVLGVTPDGGPASGPKAQALAACDASNLCIALLAPTSNQPSGGGGTYAGDGLELSLQSMDPKAPSPIIILWAGAGGLLKAVDAGGMNAAQVAAWEKQVTYAARIGDKQWSCEFRIPLSLFGKPAAVKSLACNFGMLRSAGRDWVAWMSTGGGLFQVDQAGVLVLAR
jgi:hypothetical protein